MNLPKISLPVVVLRLLMVFLVVVVDVQPDDKVKNWIEYKTKRLCFTVRRCFILDEQKQD